jgi:Fic family protein
MHVGYRYKQTSKLTQLLQALEVNRRLIDLLPSLPHIERHLRRQLILKSALFSARIEGIGTASPHDASKLEVQNILSASNWLHFASGPRRLNLKVICQFHNRILHDLSPDAGQFRHEASAIFNQAGVSIYFAPPPIEIKPLLSQLIRHTQRIFVNSIRAAMFHFGFEKIHPFLDGNGRVGRLVSTLILKLNGYDFRGLIDLEEYLDANRTAYYDLLNITSRDITPFIEFFINGLVDQSNQVINKLKHQTEDVIDTLLPRRREILNVIRDHQQVSFDFIRRRFLAVLAPTLRYDLRQLLKANLVKKLGATRGALYSPT